MMGGRAVPAVLRRAIPGVIARDVIALAAAGRSLSGAIGGRGGADDARQLVALQNANRGLVELELAFGLLHLNTMCHFDSILQDHFRGCFLICFRSRVVLCSR